jgi:hypothetical protein
LSGWSVRWWRRTGGLCEQTMLLLLAAGMSVSAVARPAGNGERNKEQATSDRESQCSEQAGARCSRRSDELIELRNHAVGRTSPSAGQKSPHRVYCVE